MQMTESYKTYILDEANRRFEFSAEGNIEYKKQYIVDNFLSSIDTDLPMILHFKNCMKDAQLYKWKSDVVVSIMMGIEDAYKKIKREI